jgi:hypothetical protein
MSPRWINSAFVTTDRSALLRGVLLVTLDRLLNRIDRVVRAAEVFFFFFFLFLLRLLRVDTTMTGIDDRRASLS